jgi:hypothetical protein
MITDALLQLASAQGSITSSTVVSTNTIDKSLARDIGSGEDLYMHFSVDTAFASGTSLTLQAIESASANLGTPTVIASTGAIATASLTQGARFAIKLPPQIGSVGLRYLGAQYVPAGTFTAGAISCVISKDVPSGNVYYASGFTVQ